MTFRDLLLDKIQETSLFEMAHKRVNILDKCLFLCGQIQLHLVKIKFFYNKNDFNHHVKDINNWIKDIQRMTLDGKKRLDKKYYYEGLFSDPIDDGDSYKDYFKDLKYDGYKPNGFNDFDEFYIEAKEAFLKISEDISKGKFITILDYFNFKG